MARATEPATFNFIAVTTAAAALRHQERRPVDGSCIAIGAATACLPSLPDIVEPAMNPNHRKFFHTITFALGLGYFVHLVYKWEADGEWERLARVAMLIGGCAYLAHLARDAFTAKSLPLV